MTELESAAPAVDQRVIVTLRGPGLDTCETSAVVDSVAHTGTFDIRLRADVDRSRLRVGAAVTVDSVRSDGLWRTQARVVDVGSPSIAREPAGWGGPRVRLSPAGSPRRIDTRRFQRLHVWTPLRWVLVTGFDAKSAAGGYTHDALEAARRDLAGVSRVERAFNLGAGGLAFVANDPVVVEDVIFLQLEDPAIDIQAFAGVVWARHMPPPPGHAGVEFLGLRDADQDRLLDYVLRVRSTRGRTGPGHLTRQVRSA
ncbi:MAG: PilZ domain-containing protein [Acidimicrobiia bacterium]|nr:PilZ domain-containing protein [Acidimicrobiia bacterium]